MRRILAPLLAASIALQPVAASATTPFFRTKPTSGAASASLGPITGPSPIRTHVQTLVDAQYAVAGASSPRWSASGLPDGLTMSSGGIVSGSVPVPGTYQATLSVASDGASESLTVPVDVYGNLTVTLPATDQAHISVAHSFGAPVVAGDPVTPVSFALKAGSFPDGMTVDASTGIVSGTPNAAGTFTYSLLATDATGADAVSNDVSVSIADADTVTMANVTGRVGTAIATVTPVVTGTPYGTLSYALSGGTLPAGLSLDARSGAVSGTPTAPTASDAAIPFVLTATDAAKTTKTAPFTVQVIAPVSFADAKSQVALVARIGQAVTLPALVLAHGPALPGTWTLASGTLPSGIQVDAATGEFLGTATGPVGTTNFALTFIDARKQSATSSLIPFKVIDGASIPQPPDVSADTGQSLQAAAPPILGTTVGTLTWTLVDDGPALVAAAAAKSPPAVATGADALPAGVAIDPTHGQVTGTSELGSISTVHYELADQSGAPPIDSPTFHVSFLTDFKVGQVAGFVTRIGDTDHTVAPTIANTRTGQVLSNDDITWARVCNGGGTDNGLSGISLDPATGIIGGTAGYPGTSQGTSESFTIYAVDPYHPPRAGGANSNCPSYGDLATNPFEIDVLYPLAVDDVLLASHIGLPISLIPAVRNQPTYPLTWSLASGSLPPGISLEPSTIDGTYPAIQGSSTTPVDDLLVIHGEDSSVHEASVDGTGHDSVTANVHLQVTPEPTLGPTVAETGRTLVGHTVAAPVVSGTVVGFQHWSVKVGTGAGLVTDAAGNATGLVLDATTGVISGVPTAPISTTVTLHFVDDAGGPGVDAQPFAVTILPALVIDHPAPLANGALAFVSHTGTASSPTAPSIENGPTGTVTWRLNGVSPMPAGLSFNTSTGVISGTPTDVPGVDGITFPQATLSIVDGASPVPATAVSAPFALSVYPALVVATIPDVNYIRVGDAFSMEAPPVSGGAVSPLAWSFLATGTNQGALNTELPAGLTMDTATGSISGTPTVPMYAPVGTFALRVVDATGAVGIQATPFRFDVEPPLAADAPGDLVTYVGASPATLPFRGDDAPGTAPTRFLTVHNKPVGNLAFSLDGTTALPAGLSLNPATGVISGNPTAATPKAAYKIHVADQSIAGDSADTPAFGVTVLPGMTLAATSPTATLRVGVPATYVPAQPVDPVGTPSYAVTPTLPGLAVDPASGTLSGTPGTASAATAVTFAVTDQGVPPQTASTTGNVTVLPPLAIEAIQAQPNGRVGTVYAYVGPFVADNVQAGHPVTWGYAGGTPVPGLTLDPSTGALTGTPTLAGTYPFSIQVRDDTGAKSAATASQTISIAGALVARAGGPTSSPYTLPLGTPATIPAPTLTGSPVLPLTYKLVGALPTGLSLNASSGVVSGSPTADGGYTASILVTDAAGSTAQVECDVTVPVPTASGGNVVTHMGVPVTVAAPAYSGSPIAPVSWTLLSGTASLPGGLVFNADGTLTGTASTAGSWQIQGSARDAGGNVVYASDGTTTSVTWSVEVRPTLTVGPVTNATFRALVTGQVVQPPSVAGSPLLPLTFSIAGAALPATLAFGTGQGTISGTPANADIGTYSEAVTVTDATGVSATTPAFAVAVVGALAAHAPSDVLVHVGQTPSATASAPTLTNGVGPFTWSLASGTLAPGLTVDASTGALDGPATAIGGPGPVTVAVVDAHDGSTATTNAYAVSVVPVFVAYAPTLSSLGHPGYATSGRPSTDTNSKTPVTWAFSANTTVQAGFGVAAATGIVSTTSASPVGTYPVAETATDATGLSEDTPSFSVQVRAPVAVTTTPLNASRPTVALSTSAPLLLRYGVNPTASVTGSFGLANAIGTASFAMGGAPAGVTVTPTGALSGVPTSTTSVQSGTFVVTGSDSSTSSTVDGSGRATLPVPYAYYGSGLGLTAYATGSYFNGDAVNVAAPVQSGSPVNAVLALNVVSGALPAGLAFNPDGSITGTAGSGGAGVFTTTLTDDTGGTYTTPQFSLTVSPALLASATYPTTFANDPAATPAGSLAALYDGSPATTSSMSATNASGVTLTYGQVTAWDGSVDTDLASGAFVVDYNAGTAAAPNWVAYASGTVASTQFRVSSTTASTPARFRLGYRSAFPHLLPSLTGARVWPVAGKPYSATLDRLLTTTNATGVETWTLLSGTVPAGLTLDTKVGTLSGTPTSYGDATLSLAVTDADGIASVPVSLVVSVQSNLQASITYPASAIDVGSGVTPTNPSAVVDGTDATSIPLAVAATYDASSVTGPAPISTFHDFNAAGNAQTFSSFRGTSYWSGVQYNFAQGVSWDGSVDLASDGSPSTTLYFNAGSPSSPAWTAYAASLGPVTSTQFQVVDSSLGAPVRLTKARLGFGSTFPAYLPSTTAVASTVLQGGTLSLDTALAPVNVAPGSTETWASTAFPTGVTLSGSTLHVDPSTVAGTYPIPLTVADTRGLASVPSTLTLTVDAPPALTSASLVLPNGAAATINAAALLGATNASAATFSASGLPTTLSLSSAGVLTGTPATTGSYAVLVTATNPDGGTATATLSLSVDAPPAILAATVTPTNGQAFTSNLATAMSATGLAGSTWTTNGLPPALSLSAGGTLSGTPSNVGSYSVPVTVTNADGLASTANLAIRVTAAPSIAAVSKTVPTGSATNLSLAVAMSSTGLSSPTWTASGLPSTLTVSTTGILSGTPTAPGSYAVSVAVTNANGGFANATLTLAVDLPPSIAAATVSPTNGQAFSANLATTMSATNLSSATWTSTTQPTGLTLSTAGVLSGTPASIATPTVTVTVTNADGLTSNAPLTLRILAAPALTAASSAINMGAAASINVATLMAATNTSSPVYAATGLPSTLTLSTAGVLSGTPSVDGSYPIAVTVTNANGGTATATLTLNVSAVPTLSAATLGLTSGTASSTNLVTAMSASGLSGAAWTASTLPADLALSAAGTLSGTPVVADAGSYPVTVKDSDGYAATATLTINVAQPATAAYASSAYPSGVSDTAGVAALYDASSTTGAANTIYAGAAFGILFNYPSETLSDGSIQAAGSYYDGGSNQGWTAWANQGTASNPSWVQATASAPQTARQFQLRIAGSDGNTEAFMTTLMLGYNSAYPAPLPSMTAATVTMGTGLAQSVTLDSVLSTVNASGTETWSLASGTLPPGLTLNASGTVTGTPTANTPGVGVPLTLADSRGIAAYPATLTIVVQAPPTLASASLTLGKGNSASTNLTSLMGASSTGTLTYSATALPSGLSLSTSGILSGTPTATGTTSVPVTATLSGTNGGKSSATAMLTLTVATPPALSAASTTIGTGSASSVDLSTLMSPTNTSSPTYVATGLPSTLTLSSVGLLSGTPTSTGSYAVAVTVTNSNGLAGSANLSLTVAAPPSISAATASMPAGLNAMVNVPASMAVSGATSPTYSATGLPSPLAMSSSGTISGAAPSTGSYNVPVTVTSSNGLSSTATLKLNVVPALLASTTFPSSLTTGAVATGTLAAAYDLDASSQLVMGVTGCYDVNQAALYINYSAPTATDGSIDTDGTQITLAYNAGTPASPVWTAFSGTVAATQFRAATTFGNTQKGGGTCGQTLSRLRIGYGNAYPTVPNIVAGTVTLGLSQQGSAALDTLMATAHATGTEAWTVASGTLPAGLSITGSTLSGTPTAAGTTSVTLSVVDASGVPSVAQSLAITVASSPTLTAASKAIASGSAANVNLATLMAASGTSSATYAATGLPSTLSLSSAGVLSGTPTATGGYSVPVTVTNSNGLSASATLTLSVDVPPSISAASQAMASGTAYSVALPTTLSATNASSATYAATGLPSTLALSGAGVLSGTPTTVGSYAVVVTVTNPDGLTATANLALTVDAAPTLAAASSSASYAAAYSTVLKTVMGATNVTGSATWTVSGAPTGYAVSGTGTTATLAASSSNAAATGSYPVAVTVTNADGGAATATLTLAILPTISAATIATTGSGYSGSLVTPMAATGTSLTWSLGSGLPTGSTLSSSGVLAVPSSAAAGTFVATVTVTSNSQVASAPLTVTVPSTAATIGAGSTTGTVGTAYSASLASLMSATNTSTPTWTVSGMPAGVTLTSASTGVISGTPTAAGTYSVTVTETNSGSSATATATLTFTVAAAATTASASNGLLAYWRFDETSGTNATDSVGGHNLTFSTAPTWAAGKLNNGATFASSNKATATWGLLQGAAPRTLSAWVKTTTAGSYTKVLGFGNYTSGSVNAFDLCLNAGTAGLCSNSTTYNVLPTANYSDGNWHLLTATYDGATARTYFDGVLSGSLAATWATTSTVIQASGDPAYSSGEYTGGIDEAGVWNRALSAAEIATLFSNTAPPAAQTLNSGLVALFHMDEGAGTTTADSVMGRIGTITSGTWGNGVSGGALAFAGATSAGVSAPWGQLTGASPRSTNTWFKTATAAAPTAQMMILGWGSSSTGQLYEVGFNPSGSTLGILTTLGDVTTSWTPYVDGNWHMATTTYDGSKISLYVDGVLKNTATEALTTTATALTIGGAPNNSSQAFKGSVDETGVWSRALSGSEVAALYGSGAPAPLQNPVNLTAGQVAYWRFEEQTGSTASDVMGTYPLTLSSAAVWTPAGKIGGGIVENGTTNSYTAASTANQALGSGNLTLSGWFKTTSTIAGDIINTGSYVSGQQADLYVTGAGTVFFSGYGGSYQAPGGTSGYNDGNWHLATATYDGSNVRVYVDGTLSSTTGMGGLAVAATPFQIGYEKSGTYNAANFMNGSLDEVGVWNRALNTSEVRALYAAGAGSSPDNQVAPTSGQVAYYKLDEGTGTTAFDSVNAYNLSWTGTYAAGSQWAATGAANGSAVFDGTDYLVDGSWNQLSGASPRTMSAWFKAAPGSNPNNAKIMAWGGSATNAYSAISVFNGTIGFSGSSNDLAVGSTGYLDGNWHMVTVTYDGSNMYLFLDGAEVAYGQKTLATATGANLSLGASFDGTLPFNGSVDEAGIWNRPLSASEVKALFTSRTPTAAPALSAASTYAIAGQNFNASVAGLMGATPAAVSNWSVVSGSLPPGIYLDPASGTLSGVMTSTTGTYAPTIQAMGTNGATTRAVLTITVGTTLKAGAATFDGSTSFVTLPQAPMAGIYDGSAFQGFTIEAWVDVSTANAISVAEFNSATATTGNVISMGAWSGGPQWIGFDSGGTGGLVKGGTETASTWTHVAFTESATGTQTLYVNGTAVTTAASQAIPPNVVRTQDYLGKSSFSGNPLFGGTMADVQVYDRSLSAAEVASSKAGGTQPGIVARYFAGTPSAADVVGANNGVVTGSLTFGSSYPY